MSTVERNRPFDKGETAETMVRELMPAIEGKTGGEYSFHLNNGDRSVGARISGEIAKRHGNQGMADAPITLDRKSTRLNSSHVAISYAVFCLKKKKTKKK